MELAAALGAKLLEEELMSVLCSCRVPAAAQARVPWLRDCEQETQAALAQMCEKRTGRPAVAFSWERKAEQLRAEMGLRRDGEEVWALRRVIFRELGQGRDVLLLTGETGRLPKGLQELCAGQAGARRFNYGTARLACEEFFGPQAGWGADPAAPWGLLGPMDFVAAAGCEAGLEGKALEEAARRRARSMAPAGARRMESLRGLGEAGAWAARLAQDMRLALAGELDWKHVDRGALLSGPPGTGKTSLARSVALEAQANFVATSASRWMSSGSLDDVLQAMERDFEQAAWAAPGILFIDEIDALGCRSASGSGSGHEQWVNWTVNHLLGLIDGFEGRAQIVVLAATNCEEAVDPALKRSGRLDRVLRVGKPGREALEEIWAAALPGSASWAPGELAELGKQSAGLTGADVERHAREAMRRAKARGGAPELMDALRALHARPMEEFESAHPAGERGPQLARTAVHEAGHAALALCLDGGKSLRWVSARPGPAGSLGFVAAGDWQAGGATRSLCKGRLAMLLAGRAAEEIRFGSDGMSAGCAQDLAQASELARAMCGHWGMGPAGRLSAGGSFRMQEDCDEQAEQMLREAYGEALARLRQNKALLDALEKELLEKGEISGARARGLAGLPEY